ncbi:hypothetical protein [Chryseobacterium oryzae]|uniref:Uncharacterized protein n=1 Tax=Chryseobacterium oryzae TaxID=2929799 RepID=A0ABY4BGW7_9FLAO|nr:hypothetical protein [Chryseobacterium oryzae]UOE38418.1 hypothetical protein MTP08_01175 [Chryseobacterium oryzae]
MINDTIKTAFPLYGIASTIAEQFIDSQKSSRDILQTNDESRINQELNRKKVETEILELEAKVAQELAISKRIESAEIVEIEEYFEGFGKGNLGVNYEEKSLKAGMSGEGRKVTKRIYRFTGFKD